MVQRTWKIPDKNTEMAVPPPEPTELDARQQLAEGLYISRPLVHCILWVTCELLTQVFHRDAIFPDFSGFPDFHKSKLSMKKL